MITRAEIGQGIETLSGAVLDELSRFDWGQPFQASIEDLGLAMGSHVGLKRKRNEDRIAAGRIQAPNSEVYTVALVCDGVGGSESGDRAATLTIATILIELSTNRIRRSLADLATHLVKRADEVVRWELGGRGTTTLCMFLASNTGELVCTSIGDSRVYSWNPESRVTQISVDDTVENELKALPGDHEGLLNVRGLKGRLSQAIGEADRSVDELRIQILKEDGFQSGVLLGSDGMWKLAKDFEAVMSNSRTAIDAVRRGINSANWVGGIDNASLVAVDNVQKFCGTSVEAKIPSNYSSLTLWVGSSKFKFFGELRTHIAEVFKLEKVKRKQPKVLKKREELKLTSQLELPVEKNLPNETRPIIEVTIRSKEKKEE